ncbi:hypothetical protein C8Q74DRAFT_1373522 [Fomes fomentarius]|nr:hypothetical protein C8Q74DRAFT_1373522 [Fomes fomentarius]
MQFGLALGTGLNKDQIPFHTSSGTSSSATLKRLAKLKRMLGENAPLELIPLHPAHPAVVPPPAPVITYPTSGALPPRQVFSLPAERPGSRVLRESYPDVDEEHSLALPQPVASTFAASPAFERGRAHTHTSTDAEGGQIVVALLPHDIQSKFHVIRYRCYCCLPAAPAGSAPGSWNGSNTYDPKALDVTVPYQQEMARIRVIKQPHPKMALDHGKGCRGLEEFSISC